MKDITITVSYDEEKFSALEIYMKRKGIKIEDEIKKTIDLLYSRTVPVGVKEYIKLLIENSDPASSKNAAKKK